MKKFFLVLAVAALTLFATAQTNQYFWYQGNLMMGNPIAQIDSITFGENEPTDTLHILLPRTIIKEVHDTVEIVKHDTVYINKCLADNGALPGEFSISATKKVRFSQGNLWYNAMAGTHKCADGTTQKGVWKFAEQQYDTIGQAQKNKSEFYDGWISVFSWGTSGWNSGANKYQPWDYSANDPQNYFVGGSQNNDLTGNYAYADWGVYNAISNGGNEPNKWRTLTKDEWNYILAQRPNCQNLRNNAYVNGINGMILLPDNFVMPDGIGFVPSDDASQNRYTLSDWILMEENGAVFFPTDVMYATKGYDANPSSDHSMGWGANYMRWSSTHRSYYQSWTAGRVSLSGSTYRCDGSFVRLVQDVE